MAWFPSMLISDGILAGQTPLGSLSNCPAWIGNNFHTSGNLAYGKGDKSQASSTSPPPDPWEGAFGSDGFGIMSYAKVHGTSQNVNMAEFLVKKPENAAFYKHTIRFILPSLSYRQLVNSGVTYDESGFVCDKVERVEYADASDTTGTVTDTWSFAVSQQFLLNKWVAGDKTRLSKFLVDEILCAFGYATINDEEYFGSFIYAISTNYYRNWQSIDGGIFAIKTSELSRAFGIEFTHDKEPIPEKDDPNDDENNPGDEEGGGEGGHDRTEDPIPVPDLPELGAADAGFITMYVMNENQMQTFATDLFADILDPTGAWQNIKALFGNPMDFIAGCLIVPFFPTLGNYYYPKFGLFTWSHSYPAIASQFEELDFGSLLIPKYYNTAFDYNPFTKIELWLPCIGYKTLDPDDVIGRSVHIKYHIDCLTGDCVAFIYVTIPTLTDPIQQVIAQFSGNCAVRVPIAQTSYDSAVNAGINLLGSMAGNIVGAANIMAEGAGGAPTSDSLTGAAKSFTVGAINSMKVNTQRSGVAGASAGYMSIMKPYVIRHIANQSLPSNYRALNGYPSNIGDTLCNFSGYTEIESIELSNVAATEAEKTEILSLLKGGCII